MGEWLPIGEAAERLGISADTVKRRIKRGELQAQREARPQGYRWIVEVPDDAPARAPAGEDPGGHTAAGEPAAGPGEVAALRDLVDVLREQLEARTRELDVRAREVAELHTLLREAQQQAHRALPSGNAPESTPEGQQTASVAGGGAEPLQQPRTPWWRFW